jgi:plasmid stability protein
MQIVNLLVKGFPDDLNRKLKAKAALEGRTLREVVVEAAQKWLKQNSSGRARRGVRTKSKRASRG